MRGAWDRVPGSHRELLMVLGSGENVVSSLAHRVTKDLKQVQSTF